MTLPARRNELIKLYLYRLGAETFQFFSVDIAHMAFSIGLAAPGFGNSRICDVSADFGHRLLQIYAMTGRAFRRVDVRRADKSFELVLAIKALESVERH